MFGITDSNLHQPILRLIAVVAGTILLTYIGSRYNLLLAFYAVVGGSVAFWLTWRFPFIAIIALFLTGGIPQILVFTPDMIEIGNTFAVGSGLNAVDIVLVLMLVAVAVRLIGDIRNGPKLLPQILLFSILLMGLWFFVSTIRNVGVFGIATVGEFRYRFLPLIIPIYIGYFCPSSQSRLQVFKVAVLGTVFLPLALFPKVGEQLGWQLGTVYRFLPPTVSLGMVCGLLALVMAKKYNYYNLWTWLIWLLRACKSITPRI